MQTAAPPTMTRLASAASGVGRPATATRLNLLWLSLRSIAMQRRAHRTRKLRSSPLVAQRSFRHHPFVLSTMLVARSRVAAAVGAGRAGIVCRPSNFPFAVDNANDNWNERHPAARPPASNQSINQPSTWIATARDVPTHVQVTGRLRRGRSRQCPIDHRGVMQGRRPYRRGRP